MKITFAGIGGMAAIITLIFFAGLWILETRKRTGADLRTGQILNGIGFGMLPGIAVWKIFESEIPPGRGTELFDPIGAIPWITEDGRFALSRIEMILAAVCFLGIILWLIARKEDLPGNGDLLLTVLCIWGLIRGFTEGLRAESFFRAGNISISQIGVLAAADVAMAVWTVRLDEAQKSTAFAILEWIAVLSCEAVTVLNTADILSAGSAVGDLAVNAGCAALCMALMLMTGRDSRN